METQSLLILLIFRINLLSKSSSNIFSYFPTCQILKSKLLLIGVGTILAIAFASFIVWCIGTYYEYKQHLDQEINPCNEGNRTYDVSNANTRTLTIITDDSFSPVWLVPPPPYQQTCADSTSALSFNGYNNHIYIVIVLINNNNYNILFVIFNTGQLTNGVNM